MEYVDDKLFITELPTGGHNILAGIFPSIGAAAHGLAGRPMAAAPYNTVGRGSSSDTLDN